MGRLVSFDRPRLFSGQQLRHFDFQRLSETIDCINAGVVDASFQGNDVRSINGSGGRAHPRSGLACYYCNRSRASGRLFAYGASAGVASPPLLLVDDVDAAPIP